MSMIDSKAVRSPAGQKLIKDLMLGDDDFEVGTAYDNVVDVDEAPTPGSRQRSLQRGALPSRLSNGIQRRGSLPVGRSSIGSAKTPSGVASDRDPAAGTPADRPATAPASSHMLIVPPQLPAARGPKDARTGNVSPLLERHLVSRHTSAYLGIVTAVLHQVSSPAATGAQRDTQRRPGTVPRDVYHHSAIAPPKRHHLSNMSTSQAIPVSSDGTYSGAPAVRVAGPGSPTGPLRVFSNVGFDYPESVDLVGSPFCAPFYPGGGGSGGGALGTGGGSLSSRGGSGEYYMPYLDRSYGSHAPLACTVDALARRAEAHKALTRQSLLQKQLEQQMASGRRKAAQKDATRQQQQQQVQDQQGYTQQQKKLQIVLQQPAPNEPYQLRMEGGVPPTALGLAWNTSPGVVAAAAAAAATTAAAIAARAEGLSAAVSPFLRDPTASPSLREIVPTAANNRVNSASRGSVAALVGSSLGSPQRRRVRGSSTPEYGRPPTGLAGSGRTSPTGAPGSPLKVRWPRMPLSAAEAAVLAAEAEEMVRSHLPPAVRRGYNGQLAAQTIKDWETIAEPNRRMMQEIENATNLVRGNPSRTSTANTPVASGGGGGDSRAQTPLNARGSASTKRRVGSQEVAAASAYATASEEAAGADDDGAPFGKHTSARARRRYIRYSLDVFPELGLPPRSNTGHRGASGANGPFGTANVAAAAAAAATATASPAAMAAAAAASGWGPWEVSTAAAPGLFSLDSEPSSGQPDIYHSVEIYGEGEYGAPYSAAKGPRYVLAAAARVPVPIHLHPLPTPPAAIAAVVASGGAAGAAAAALPQWVDPLTAANSGAIGNATASSGAIINELDSAIPGLQLSISGGPTLVLPTTVGSSSQGSMHSSRGPSRTTSIPMGTLSARGVGLQGHPSVPPFGSPATSVILDEPYGCCSGGGSGIASRNASVNRLRGKQVQGMGTSGGYADDSQYTSPQSSHRDAVVDSPRHHAIASTSMSSATVGRGSPSIEPSLLPLAQVASVAAFQSESTQDRSESPDVASPRAPAMAAASPSPDLNPARAIRGLDLDLNLDLGPALSRAAEVQRRGLDLASSSADSHSYVPDGHPLSGMEKQNEEAYHTPGEVKGAEQKGLAWGGSGSGSGSGGTSKGWSFRDGGFTTMASPAGGITVVASSLASANTGAEEPEWDAGPTPRLVSRQSGPKGGAPSAAAVRAVSPLSRRSSSVASDTIGSASLGSFTTRSGGYGAASGLPSLELQSVRIMSSQSAEAAAMATSEAATAAAPTDRGLKSREYVERSIGGVSAGFRGDTNEMVVAAAAGQGSYELGETDSTNDGFASSGEEATPDMSSRRPTAVVAAPQGPVLTHGTGYRVVTSVAASLVSEDPREVARLAAQRDVEAQLERSSEHTAKLKAASRATKALARAGPQHSALLPATLPPLSLPVSPPPGSGYSIVQPRASRMGFGPPEEPQGGALSILDAPVPAPAEMEAMASAARAALSPAQPAMRRLTQHLQSEKERHSPATSRGPDSYMHIQATIEAGRTAQMQDVWAT